MDEEFEVNILVDQLINSLGSTLSPEDGLEILNRANEKPFHVNPEEYKQLALLSENPTLFINKYEQLSSKKIPVLEPCMRLLSYINAKSKVPHVLNKRILKMSSILDRPGPSIVGSPYADEEALNQVKSRLTKCVSDIDKKKMLDNSLIEKKSQLPEFSRWKEVRSFMSFDFPIENDQIQCFPLGGVPISSQEFELIEDLLVVLMGCQGKFIQANSPETPNSDRVFHISNQIDKTLRSHVYKILPLGSHYSHVLRFVEERKLFEWGRINQALADALEDYINDFLNFLYNVEDKHRDGYLNLTKLWSWLQPTFEQMEFLANICVTLTKAEARGGRTLSILHEQLNSCRGNQHGKPVCMELIQKACAPFFQSLDYWIHVGHIFDPLHDEFMIIDNVSIEKSENDMSDGKYSEEYWVQRYIIKPDNVPTFLDGIKHKILRTGKYLNVIRKCRDCPQSKIIEKQQQDRKSTTLRYSAHNSNFVSEVDQTYEFASSCLLGLLMNHYDLVGRIRSVKRYFLLEQGDFIVKLMDLCEAELIKPINEVVPSKLETLLDLSLRLSSGGRADPYKENIRMVLLPHQLNFQIFTILTISTIAENDYKKPDLNKSLTGLEAFSLGLNVEWPLSLIFNQKIIGCYQMLFRHLLLCKHVERQLCSIWSRQKSFKSSVSDGYQKSFALRQSMLFTIQNLGYYMMEEVIEPNYEHFIKTLHEAKNMDDIMERHWCYLSQCMKECMLTSPLLMRTVKQLITCCVEFCEYVQNEDVSDSSLVLEDSSVTQSMLSNEEQYETQINKYHDDFSHTLLSLLEAITQNGRDDKGDRLFNILYRENFSGFHTKALDHRLVNKVPRKQSQKERTVIRVP